MGFFKDLNQTKKMAKDINKNFDPQALRSQATLRRQQAIQRMNEQTAAMNAVAADGMPATAQVVSVGNSTSMINSQPMVPVELLVIAPGAAPRPVSTTLVIPMMSVARVQPGATLPVTVSASNPNAVVVNWAG